MHGLSLGQARAGTAFGHQLQMGKNNEYKAEERNLNALCQEELGALSGCRRVCNRPKSEKFTLLQSS